MSKFEIFLHKSDELREGYIKSMELPDKDFEHIYKMDQEDELHNFVNSFIEY